jgi:hypothetical protein
MADQYYTVRVHKYKSMVYQVNMESDKRKKPEIKQIEIKGKFPKARVHAKDLSPAKSYLNHQELLALRREPSFTCYEQSGDYVVTEIPFKDLPEELQKEYDIDAYRKLKQDAK